MPIRRGARPCAPTAISRPRGYPQLFQSRLRRAPLARCHTTAGTGMFAVATVNVGPAGRRPSQPTLAVQCCGLPHSLSDELAEWSLHGSSEHHSDDTNRCQRHSDVRYFCDRPEGSPVQPSDEPHFRAFCVRWSDARGDECGGADAVMIDRISLALAAAGTFRRTLLQHAACS